MPAQAAGGSEQTTTTRANPVLSAARQHPPRPPGGFGPLATAIIIVLVVAVVVLAVVAGSLYEATKVQPTTVVVLGTTLNPTSENGTCWGPMSGSSGGYTTAQRVTLTWTLSYTAGADGPELCTVTSVSVQTAGFVFVSANVPLTVESGHSGVLNVVVQTPESPYTGSLNLNMAVTAS